MQAAAAAAGLGADDAEREAVIQAVRAAQGPHEIADLQLVAVAPFGGDQVGQIDFQHGEVGHVRRRRRPSPWPRRPSVSCTWIDVGAVDHVKVRDDVAVRIDDHAGALPFEAVAARAKDAHDAGFDALGDQARGEFQIVEARLEFAERAGGHVVAGLQFVVIRLVDELADDIGADQDGNAKGEQPQPTARDARTGATVEVLPTAVGVPFVDREGGKGMAAGRAAELADGYVTMWAESSMCQSQKYCDGRRIMGRFD